MSNRTTDLEKKLTEHTSKVLKPTNPLNERNERKRETRVKPEASGEQFMLIFGDAILFT